MTLKELEEKKKELRQKVENAKPEEMEELKKEIEALKDVEIEEEKPEEVVDERNENIVFIGNSGVGKTHLAVSLGIEAAKHRNSVYFITCHNLMQKLNKAQKENRLDKQLQHLAQYKVLIIDEIGYLPVDHQGSNLLFQLIARRYMNKSTIVTTNMPFSRWGEVFSDNTLASAVLDRLLHYSHIIRITGNSYRIKDKIVESDSRTNKYNE